jgi:pyruvate/2-oxoglutarate dehydrogenase complex dihydrolipoamide acyltransferase (E2) component
VSSSRTEAGGGRGAPEAAGTPGGGAPPADPSAPGGSAPSAGPATLVDVTMPQMGVSVAEGTVVAWRVQVGDPIAADETICDISTDKIDTEVPSPASGVVAEILVPVDTTVEVGTVLARISTADAGEAAAAGAPPSEEMLAAAAEPGAVQPDTTAPDPTKAQATQAAPLASGNGAAAAPERPYAATGGGQPGGGSAARRYSPVVQRIAAEHGVDLDQVPGTGRGGRVRKQDVLAFVQSGGGAAPSAAPEEPPLHIESPYRPEPSPAPAPAAPAPAPAAAAGPLPTTAGPLPAAPGPVGEATPIPAQLSRMRRQIGEHMKRSLDTAATCTTWIEVDLSRVEAARARLGVTALSFVARASIEALRDYPALNAWLEDDRYTQHQGVNLGIAVSLGEDGLIVPVIHGAHQLSVEGLAARIRDLARRARARQLSPDEVRGGTFTITNPGQYGSIMATPIINQPQVAILDLEAVIKRPVVVTSSDGSDSISIRPMTILGLSWDHRALDGAMSAQFLAAVKRRLETVAT